MQHILELEDEKVVEGLRVTRFLRYMNTWSDRARKTASPLILLKALRVRQNSTASKAEFKMLRLYVFEVDEMVSLLMPLCPRQLSLRSPRYLDKDAYIVVGCGFSSFFSNTLSTQLQSLKYIKQRCQNILSSSR